MLGSVELVEVLAMLTSVMIRVMAVVMMTTMIMEIEKGCDDMLILKKVNVNAEHNADVSC